MMLNRCKFKTLALTALLIPGMAFASEPPKYDVCEQELRTRVRDELQQTVTRIEYFYHYDTPYIGRALYRPTPTTQAIVYTKECPGYHFFDVHASYETCTQLAHYGTPPRYSYLRSSNDGCG
jgi:hypothetical protein